MQQAVVGGYRLILMRTRCRASEGRSDVDLPAALCLKSSTTLSFLTSSRCSIYKIDARRYYFSGAS